MINNSTGGILRRPQEAIRKGRAGECCGGLHCIIGETMRVTEKRQGDLSPGPAKSEGSIVEGNRACFCLHVPRFMSDEAGFAWPA